jgi:hypothetical protein
MRNLAIHGTRGVDWTIFENMLYISRTDAFEAFTGYVNGTLAQRLEVSLCEHTIMLQNLHGPDRAFVAAIILESCIQNVLPSDAMRTNFALYCAAKTEALRTGIIPASASLMRSKGVPAATMEHTIYPDAMRKEAHKRNRHRLRLPPNSFSDTEHCTKHKQRQISPAESSIFLVPVGFSVIDAERAVRPAIHPDLRTPEFISYAAITARAMQLNVVDFLEWQNAELIHKGYVLEDKRKELERKKALKAKRIRERDIRDAVCAVFDEEFEQPCELGCGKNITVDSFYVAKICDALCLCCRACSQCHARKGLPISMCVATSRRRRAWKQVAANSVRAHCFVCGPNGGSMHFYLDSWHTGQNRAKGHGRKLHEDNARPLHPQCNYDQGIETFDEHKS